MVYPLDEPMEHDGYIGDYTLDSFNTKAGDVEGFFPIAQLNRSEADVSLYFVSANDIVYPNQVDDPLYSAHFQWGTYYGEDSNMTLYCRDAPATVLACAHQHQLCYAGANSSSLSSPSESCQPLLGITQMTDTFYANPNITSKSAQAAGMLILAMWYGFSAQHTVRTLGISALTARQSLHSGTQAPLPPNQWQHEVQHWHDTSLAVLQRQVIELANGPFDQNIVPLLERPRLDVEKRKVVNTNYSSFSVLGLSILLGIGGFINLVGYTLDWIVEAIQKRYNLDIYSRLEWTTNDTLQLQRLAHEELGLGTWSGKESSYPITMKGERLAVLEVTGPGAPKLSKPPRTYEVALNGSDYPGHECDSGRDKQSTLSGGSESAGQ
ncbi:hypothetical protein BFW01_g7488 [Lasiodiplodia theobromae]|nr:hypothetical protein BFW01_g7488 [Lasiodiplodia theobromae]